MSSTALKTLAVILVGLAVILGFVAYKLSLGLTQDPEPAVQTKAETAADQTLAVVATASIPAYQPIPMESVALVPISVEPPQYFKNVNAVVGRTPLRSISVGTPITDESFGSANTLAQAIPPGTQAMSLAISDVIAVGGFVKPGDIVDVLVYIRASGREVKNTQARILLKSARVLAYQERVINASVEQKKEGESRQQRRERTAVIAVPDADTTKVLLGASLGKLRLALRGPNSDLKPGQQAPSATDDKPEALAPVALTSKTQEKVGKKKETKDEREKAITLAELTGIKKKRKANGPPPAPRATIEVFEGNSVKRISRPY